MRGHMWLNKVASVLGPLSVKCTKNAKTNKLNICEKNWLDKNLKLFEN